MKQCSYCGKKNPDEASHCSECGTLLTPPKYAASKRKFSAPKNLFFRLLIATCVWVIISGISLRVAWRDTRESVAAWTKRWATQNELKSLNALAAAYRQEFNSCPTNLEQLRKMTNESWIKDYEFIDGWGHPLVLSNKASNCLIISYGADGKPGGTGIDADLSTQDLKPKGSAPTFAQFWNNERMQDMIMWCFICGALAAVLSFITVKVPDFTRHGWMVLGLSLGATLIGALVVTSLITAVHIPSGH